MLCMLEVWSIGKNHIQIWMVSHNSNSLSEFHTNKCYLQSHILCASFRKWNFKNKTYWNFNSAFFFFPLMLACLIIFVWLDLFVCVYLSSFLKTMVASLCSQRSMHNFLWITKEQGDGFKSYSIIICFWTILEWLIVVVILYLSLFASGIWIYTIDLTLYIKFLVKSICIFYCTVHQRMKLHHEDCWGRHEGSNKHCGCGVKRHDGLL